MLDETVARIRATRTKPIQDASPLQETVNRVNAGKPATPPGGENIMRVPCDTLAAKQSFLAYFAEHGRFLESAKHAGRSGVAVYDWIKSDKDFSTLYEQAKQAYIEKLEREVDRRAFTGREKPVFQGGEQVGATIEYSDLLAIFRLKALAPERYRDNTTSKVSGEVVFRVEYEPLPQLPAPQAIAAIDSVSRELPAIESNETDNVEGTAQSEPE